MDETSILQRCQQGEIGLLDDLVRLHADSLYRFCYHLCGNTDNAAELFQDTWVKALRNINYCRTDRTILSWLFTIAVNTHRDKYRRSMLLQRILPRQAEAPPDENPDDKLVDNERHHLVRQALNGLKDTYRIPMVLFYFDDHSIEEISSLLSIPAGTVKSRLHRAKKHMKSSLEVLL